MATLCAVALSTLVQPASSAPAPSAEPSGCAARPSWIESASTPEGGGNPFESCFSGRSSLAEAVLSITNNRPYAQLLTVTGTTLDLAESGFAGSAEAALSAALADVSPASGPSAFLLGPSQSAILAIDRPPPGPAQVVDIVAAPANAFAVAALAWRLLSAAAMRLSLPASTRSCIASAVYGALQGPPQPEAALERVHACVNGAPLTSRAKRILRALAASLLIDRAFREVIHRQGTEPHPARIAFTVAPSDPYLVNPAIQLQGANIGSIPSDSRSVRHLSATGGVPPYRFYIVPEPGGPAVPSWLHLAADGTLIIEPPLSSVAVNLAVEVVDSNGEHSVVDY
jgi:hypothetical protein